jgi:AcrR family transcriptional regulator
MARVRRTAEQTREQILAVASRLFYWQGIRSTGIDRVAAEAGVAPPTLYRLFASKDDLVAAYIRRNDAGYRAWFTAAASDGVLPLFEALLEQVQPEQCRGCPYLMALAEYPDHESEVHALAVATKAWVRDRLHELAGADLLGDQLTLLFEGVYASVQALGVDGPARHAVDTARALLKQ